jgi:hypothetical protein
MIILEIVPSPLPAAALVDCQAHARGAEFRSSQVLDRGAQVVARGAARCL